MKKTSLVVLFSFILAIVLGSFLFILSYHSAISEQIKIILYFSCSIFFFVLTTIHLQQVIIQRHEVFRINKEKKDTQIKLHEEQSRFETIFDRSNNSIALLSLEGRFQRVNKAICELLGYSDKDMHAMNFFYL